MGRWCELMVVCVCHSDEVMREADANDTSGERGSALLSVRHHRVNLPITATSHYFILSCNLQPNYKLIIYQRNSHFNPYNSLIHQLGTCSNLTSPFLMKLFTIDLISKLSTSSLLIKALGKVVQTFNQIFIMVYATYNQNRPIIITNVIYKHISFIHLNMGELVELHFKILQLYIFSQLLGGGGWSKTYVSPPTFHIGGSSPLLGLPLSTPLSIMRCMY